MFVRQIGKSTGTLGSDGAGLYPERALVQLGDRLPHHLGDGVSVAKHGDDYRCPGYSFTYQCDRGHSYGLDCHRLSLLGRTVPKSDLVIGFAEAFGHCRAECPGAQNRGSRIGGHFRSFGFIVHPSLPADKRVSVGCTTIEDALDSRHLTSELAGWSR